MSEPTAEMLALAERVERFIATSDDTLLDRLFAAQVTIIEKLRAAHLS